MKNHKILPLFTLIIDQRVDNQIISPLFWNSLILNYFVGQNNHSGLVSFFIIVLVSLKIVLHLFHFYFNKCIQNSQYKKICTALKPSFTRPWDYMILTVWMAFSPEVPMYKNSKTVCIPSPKYCLYMYICF